MTNSAMLVCSFFIKKKYSREDGCIYPLNETIPGVVNDNEIMFDDCFKLISLFCEQHSSFLDDEKSKKMFSVKPESMLSFDDSTYRAVTFIIQSGNYGVEADMTNRHTNTISYHRSEDEADVKAFQCVVYIPKDVGNVHVTKGILVFQSIATYGVKTITVDIMKRFLGGFGLTLETRSVSVQSFIEKLIQQGALHKITLFKNNISPNVADNILISSGREEKSYIKPQLNPQWLQKILAVFGKADNNGVVEIPDDENFDDLSIQFKLGDRLRTVRLRSLDRLSIVEDIPDGIISKDSNGSLVKHMIETANAYKNRIVFENR